MLAQWETIFHVFMSNKVSLLIGGLFLCQLKGQ